MKKNNEPWWQETIDTPATEYIEENFYVEETLVKNKDLIRIEMNLIQLPIFSKNTKRKVNQIIKYYFNSNRDTYITVTPAAGDYIPGEMEEKVFIALMQIMKEKGMPKQFTISSIELRDKLNLNTGRYISAIKNSLMRLSQTNYKFKNTMYSSEFRRIMDKEISTSILSLEIITLTLKQNEKYRNRFNDKRIKEVYKITITDHFYNNIIQRGYMVYNSKILLEIQTSTARTIYMLIEKLRFDKRELKIDTIFLIKRIPLKFDKTHLSQTIITLKKAFDELKDKKLIEDFNFIKESTWEKSEIEIFFNEKSNDEKQQRFYEDRNDFRKLLTNTTVSDTEHEMIENIEVDEKTNQIKEIIVTQEMIDKILGLMPSKARTLKKIPKTIKEEIIQYGYSKVEAVAIYMKKNKVDKVRAYFIKALENNWYDDEEFILEIPKKVNITLAQEEKNIEDIPENYEKEMEYFESLSEEKKIEIEEKVYKAYIKECGQESKIQKLAFKGARRKLIAEYIKNNHLLKNDSIVEILEEKKPKEDLKSMNTENSLILIEKEKLRNYIDEYVDIYIDLVEEKKLNSEEIKKKIVLDCMRDYLNKTLTLEKLESIIKKNLI